MLVERDEQLRRLDHLLAESFAGRGGVVSLEAPASCGRTQLLGTFTRRAADQDALVLTATCSAAEHTLPFSTLSQLLHRPKVPARLVRLPEAGTADGTLTPELARIFHQVLLAVLQLAAEQPVVLAVDNVSSADPVSRRCLLHLAGRLGAARVLMAFTDDAEPLPAHLPFRAELSRQANFQRLRFGPLSMDGVVRLLGSRWNESTVDLLAPEFFRISGGNPLLLNALADDYDASGSVRRDGYGLAVLSWLHRCEPAAARIVHGLAVLGDDTSAAELAALLDTDADTVDRELDAMTAAGLLDKGQLPHPIARSIVLDDLTGTDRAELHRRAARVRHDRGGPSAAVARHLVEAGPSNDTWTVEVLLDAAEPALSAGDVPLAVACFKLAHGCCPDDDSRIAILAKLAQAEWQANPSTAAPRLASLAVAARAGRLDQPDGLTVVHQLLWHGRNDEAEEVLEVIRTVGTDDEAGGQRDFETWLAWAHPRMARRHKNSAAAPDKPVGKPATDPWLRSTAALADSLTAGQLRDAVDGAERCLAGLHFRQRTGWADEAVALALQILTGADRLDTAARWCHRLLAEAAGTQATTWQATITAALAEVALRQGDLTGAMAHARTALELLTPKAWGVVAGYPLSTYLIAATRKGDYAQAAEFMRRPLPDAMFDSRYGPLYLHARGHYHLAVNHSHRALADFLSCGELLHGWGLDMASLVPWRTSAAEAWLQLGNHDQARQLTYEQTARPDAGYARIRALSLRMLAATSPAGRRPELLTEALELFEQCGDRFEQAQVLTDLSHGHHALGENRRARMVFRRAWHLAEVAGAAPLAQKLLRADDHPGSRPVVVPRFADVAALTASEQRVASLAVLGCSNREIAGKLHITVSTVEQHLTRVYRKLKVKRRKDLPVELGSGMS